MRFFFSFFFHSLSVLEACVYFHVSAVCTVRQHFKIEVRKQNHRALF